MTGTRARFRLYCGMTCVGGSENKGCACAGPAQCEMKGHPLYEAYRAEAESRMAAWIADGCPPIPSKVNHGSKN